VTREAGFDMRSLGAKRLMVVVDPALTKSETTSKTLKAFADEGIDTAIYDAVHVEPTEVFGYAIELHSCANKKLTQPTIIRN
jgi:hydroxyacid-oxoacid transhydrogenase